MSLPAWSDDDAFIATSPNWNLYGADWQSLVQGDVTKAVDWDALFPADVASAAAVAASIPAPDGVGAQAQAFHVNALGNAAGRGLKAHRFVAAATGNHTESVAMALPPSVAAATVVVAICTSAGAVIAKTLATRTSGQPAAVFSVTAAVTDGVEYACVLGFNWTAEGGSAQARAYVSKVRLAPPSAAEGVFAQPFVRYDRSAGIATWPRDVTGVSNDEIVLDVSTGACAVECIDFVAGGYGAIISAEHQGVFVGPQSGVPTQLAARLISTADRYNKYRLHRAALPRGPKRISARSTQWAKARAVYVPAKSDVATPPLPAVVLVGLGDSIMAENLPGATQSSALPTFGVAESWNNQLRAVIHGAVVCFAGGGADLTGTGYGASGGVFTPNAVLRAAVRARIQACQPDLFLLQTGTNDFGNGRAASDFAISVSHVLDDVAADNPGVQIVVLGPIKRTSPPEGSANAAGSTLQNFRDAEAAQVAARAGWAVPPVYANGNDPTVNVFGSIPDGAHPDFYYQSALARLVTAVLVALGY